MVQINVSHISGNGSYRA